MNILVIYLIGVVASYLFPRLTCIACKDIWALRDRIRFLLLSLGSWVTLEVYLVVFIVISIDDLIRFLSKKVDYDKKVKW